MRAGPCMECGGKRSATPLWLNPNTHRGPTRVQSGIRYPAFLAVAGMSRHQTAWPPGNPAAHPLEPKRRGGLRPFPPQPDMP